MSWNLETSVFVLTPLLYYPLKDNNPSYTPHSAINQLLNKINHGRLQGNLGQVRCYPSLEEYDDTHPLR